LNPEASHASRIARKLRPSVLAAAVWTLIAAMTVRRQLKTEPVDKIHVPAPPPLPPTARPGVIGALSRLRATCLVRGAVLQCWDAAHGQPRDLIIGVTAPGTAFKAHAWLDGEPPCEEEGFHELLRLTAQ
jgi:hypothetical protein